MLDAGKNAAVADVLNPQGSVAVTLTLKPVSGQPAEGLVQAIAKSPREPGVQCSTNSRKPCQPWEADTNAGMQEKNHDVCGHLTSMAGAPVQSTEGSDVPKGVARSALPSEGLPWSRTRSGRQDTIIPTGVACQRNGLGGNGISKPKCRKAHVNVPRCRLTDGCG